LSGWAGAAIELIAAAITCRSAGKPKILASLCGAEWYPTAVRGGGTAHLTGRASGAAIERVTTTVIGGTAVITFVGASLRFADVVDHALSSGSAQFAGRTGATTQWSTAGIARRSTFDTLIGAGLRRTTSDSAAFVGSAGAASLTARATAAVNRAAAAVPLKAALNLQVCAGFWIAGSPVVAMIRGQCATHLTGWARSAAIDEAVTSVTDVAAVDVGVVGTALRRAADDSRATQIGAFSTTYLAVAAGAAFHDTAALRVGDCAAVGVERLTATGAGCIPTAVA
jgi:hypothetical protein